jgi:hypothetical protein
LDILSNLIHPPSCTLRKPRRCVYFTKVVFFCFGCTLVEVGQSSKFSILPAIGAKTDDVDVHVMTNFRVITEMDVRIERNRGREMDVVLDMDMGMDKDMDMATDTDSDKGRGHEHRKMQKYVSEVTLFRRY